MKNCMISNPKHGWCNFNLGTFEGTPSYLTDVPLDLLVAFIDYHNKGCGVAWFDEEGTEFSLVITPYSLFIIEEKERIILYDLSEMNIENIEKELVEDIENNLYGWIYFMTDDNPEEIKQYEIKLMKNLSTLKKYIGG